MRSLTGRNPIRSTRRAALAGGTMLLAGAAAFGPPATAQGVVRYVDADAAPGGDGTSWADAFRDLQAALATAEAGDEVWIAEGVYKPTAGSDRTATFVLRSGVAFYGGFDGTEQTREERDWTANESILSGDIGVQGDDDNAYHVVTAPGVDSTALLDGLTVRDGHADADPAPHDRGAGLYAPGGSPTVRNGRFLANVAAAGGEQLGGGLYVEGGAPLVEDVLFEGNVGGGAGLCAMGAAPVLRRVVFRDNGGTGAVAFMGGSTGLVEDALFEGNTGSAVAMVASSPTFRRVTLRDNVVTQAGTDGAGAYILGGAPRFEDCLFEDLRTRHDLAGLGGGAYVNVDYAGDEPSRAVFLRSTFRDGTANQGGAAYVSDSPALFLFCRFEHNRALAGGALHLRRTGAAVIGSAFVGNRAEPGTSSGLGGALDVSGSSPPEGGPFILSTLFAGNQARHGGAATLSGTGTLRAELVNVTLSGNRASESGGALRLLNAGGVRLRNAVLWGNEAPLGAEVYVANGAGPTVEQAIIAGACPVGASCTGVTDADPLLVRAPSPGADGTWGTEDDDYGDLRLQAGSPAIDAGLASLLPADVWDLDLDGDTTEPLPLDAAGQPRIEGAEVDLGAYEGAAAAVSVRVASVGAPLVGAGGGTFEFTVTLANPTGEPVALQAWSEVAGPVAVSPLLGPVALTLPAGATLTRRLVQAVPAQAPAGTYTYTVAVGTFGGAVVAADSFRVTKQGATRAATRGATAGSEGWAVSGWDAAPGAPELGAPEPGGAALSLAVVPNPARGVAAVTLTLPRPSAVRLVVYDVLGREVAAMEAGTLAAGPHRLGLDVAALPAGVYVWRLAAGERVETGRLTVVR